MITIHEDEYLGLRIKWNQDELFQVWNGDIEVDVFHTSTKCTLEDAIRYAKEYCEMVHNEMMSFPE